MKNFWKILTRITTSVIRRFTDQDHDWIFTQELFNKSLSSFKEMNIQDLHFKSIKDIADHYDENWLMFERMHDFEHLLFVAVQRSLAPSDDEMIGLRARIQAFTMAERMVTQIQYKAVNNPDVLLNDKTTVEFAEDVYTSVNKKDNNFGISKPPMVGENLSGYLHSMTKRLRQEHRDRQKPINLMYGLAHPQNVTNEDGDEVTLPGTIPENEPLRRMALFQKDSFTAEYCRNTQIYMNEVHHKLVDCVDIIHSRRTGTPILKSKAGKEERVLIPFLLGKGSAEIIRVKEILQKGRAVS